MNVTGKGKRQDILRWLKLRGEWLFMDAFLQPIHEFRNTPILLHIGGCKKEAVKFIPVLFAFISDTKEANDICGVKGAPMCKVRCRMCLSAEPMHRTYKDPDMMRTDDVSEAQGRRGQEACCRTQGADRYR